MSQVIDLCEDSSDDNGESPNTASLPSLPLSRKRRRDKEESSNDAHPRNDGAGKSAHAGGWEKNFKALCEYHQSKGHSDFRCPDPEYVELSNWVFSQRGEYKRMVEGEDSIMSPERVKTLEGIGFVWKTKLLSLEERDVMKAERKAAGKCAQNMNAVDEWTKKFKELCRYRQSKGHYIFRGQDPADDELSKWVASLRSEYRYSMKQYVILTPERVKALKSIGFVWKQSSRPSWEDHLSELADYRKINGHCSVPTNYSENTKLGNWVAAQRSNYRLYQEGKTSAMTLSRIQEMESLGFEWVFASATWESRLSELADYRTIHGHCNVPTRCSESTQLSIWVGYQRNQYKLHREGKTSPMTVSRIQKLESLCFKWACSGATWEDRLSELADYRKINGHCSVPAKYSGNSKLGNWVATQRRQFRLHQEGKTSAMTLSRIQELESMGFQWQIWDSWEDRLSELADYRKIHGHCNIPRISSENAKLGLWVGTQRAQYRFHREGNSSAMTLYRIQELEGLGFDWEFCISSGKGIRKKSNLDGVVTSSQESDVESPEQHYSQKKIAALEKSAAMQLTSLSNPMNPTD
jgi:hypothetical protein